MGVKGELQKATYYTVYVPRVYRVYYQSYTGGLSGLHKP